MPTPHFRPHPSSLYTLKIHSGSCLTPSDHDLAQLRLPTKPQGPPQARRGAGDACLRQRKPLPLGAWVHKCVFCVFCVFFSVQASGDTRDSCRGALSGWSPREGQVSIWMLTSKCQRLQPQKTREETDPHPLHFLWAPLPVSSSLKQPLNPF